MDGFVNVLKPSGPTASDIVVRLKGIYKQKKIGHLGTLDPGAAGVLPVALGKGTKLFDFLTFKVKKYRAFFTFGKTTDTLDSYGKVTEKAPFSVDDNKIREATRQFIGKIKQVPPAYSALSINGRRAYDLARKGVELNIPSREVEVFAFDLVRQVSCDTWCFDITCGGGTYIRSLATDLAKALNTVGYMSCLIRLSSGEFDISDAKTIEEISLDPLGCLLDLQYPLKKLERLDVPKNLYKQLQNGVKISDFRDFDDTMSKIDYQKIYCDGEFFGVGKFVDGKLEIKYRLNG